MELVSRVDEQGRFVEDVILREDDLPEGCLQSRPPEGFHSPRWTGSEWTEDKPEAEILDGAKAEKINELAARAVEHLAAPFPEGRDELMLVLCAHVVRLCEALGVPTDPRLSEVVTTGENAMQKKAEVEGAATVGELESVAWTVQS